MTLTAQNLSFAYGATPILQNFSLVAEPGQVLGLLGPNGSGKSTFLKIIARVIEGHAGQVHWQGETDLAGLNRRDLARIVGYVPQSSAPAFHLSVVDAVLLGRTPFFDIRPREEDWQHVWAAIETLGLLPLARRSVAELSGGQAQRVLIARALAQQPSLLLLDEPTSALDLRYQVETLRLMQEVARKRNVAVVVAIHDLNQAARYCDRVAFLSGGALQAHGTPEEVYSEALIEAIYGLPVEIERERQFVEVRPAEREPSYPALIAAQ